ncbi:MAG: SUMF1/EgtB/PvdO family nonheme iron enzyme, partial [Chrysiogenales bacterium]
MAKEKKSVTIQLVDIFPDNPEKERVDFGYTDYAKTIAGIIANPKNETPLVIGVYGAWGSGKTTLMLEVQRLLQSELIVLPNNKVETPPFADTPYTKEKSRKMKTVWFQAWKYKGEDEILTALINEIVRTMKSDSWWAGAKAELEKTITANKDSSLLSRVLNTILGSDILSDLKTSNFKDKAGFYDKFLEIFDRLVWCYLTRTGFSLTEKLEFDSKKAVLAVFIDDLDRCPKEKILPVLETIKLFLDHRCCVFIIGAARDIIEAAIGQQYQKEAGKFMEKIIQVGFDLPPIPEPDLQGWLGNMAIENRDKIIAMLPVLAPAFEQNPRRFKRFLNDLNLTFGIFKNKNLTIDLTSIFHLKLIEYLYPNLAAEIKGNPEHFFSLQEYMKKAAASVADKKFAEISEDVLRDIPQHWYVYVRDSMLRKIFAELKCTIEELRHWGTYSAIFRGDTGVKPLEKSKGVDDFDVWVKIPAGDFLYQDKQTLKIEKAFEIGIYPVTNAQFARFIAANGYRDESCWSQEGWQWQKGSGKNKPYNWEKEDYNQSDYPVIGICWYEAEAYCNWLTRSQKDGHTYRLPKEEEWERAACSTDGQAYPWGNDWDKEKCNSSEAKIDHPTTVTRYPEGRSPAGCYDMAGHVWEWTTSKFDEKT